MEMHRNNKKRLTINVTFSWWFNIRKLLRFQHFTVAIVCDFEHKTPINHTVPGFKPSMTNVPMV